MNVTGNSTISLNDTLFWQNVSDMYNSSVLANDMASRKMIMTVAAMILMVFICTGNALVMIVILTNKELQTITNSFVFNLAVVDFLTGLVLLQGVVILVNQEAFYSPAGCYIGLLLRLLLPHISALSLLCEYDIFFFCVWCWYEYDVMNVVYQG